MIAIFQIIEGNQNSAVFSMTASAPSVVISNGKPKVNREDVTNTMCIRKGDIKIHLITANTFYHNVANKIKSNITLITKNSIFRV